MRIEDTKIRLKRLYDDVFDPKEPALAERMAGPRRIHDQAQIDAERIEAMLRNAGEKAISPTTIRKLAASAREKCDSQAGLSPRTPAGAGAACRGRRARSPHQRVEARAAQGVDGRQCR